MEPSSISWEKCTQQGSSSRSSWKTAATSAVEITYDLETPVRADLYDYFLSSFDK